MQSGGVIEDVGAKVTKGWKKGDRIASFVHGSNPTQHEDGTLALGPRHLRILLTSATGCFAEYCVAKGDFGLKVQELHVTCHCSIADRVMRFPIA